MRSRLPSQFSELPSNITHGLCFDLLTSHSPQPPLKPHAYCTECVCAGPQGWMHSVPLSLLCSKFTLCCPYSHCQFLPCLYVNVCSSGLITAEQGLALSPVHFAIRTLRGILLLLLLYSLRLFFKSVRDSCSRPGSCKSLLRLFGWILFGFREVWAEWCMIQCTGNHTRIGCYRHDSVRHAMLHLSAFSLNHHIITPFKGNFNGFLVKVNGLGAGREF